MLTERIDELVIRHGGLRAAARVLGIDPAYLSKLRQGKKTNPSTQLLRRLKLQRVVTISFVPIKN